MFAYNDTLCKQPYPKIKANKTQTA